VNLIVGGRNDFVTAPHLPLLQLCISSAAICLGCCSALSFASQVKCRDTQKSPSDCLANKNGPSKETQALQADFATKSPYQWLFHDNRRYGRHDFSVKRPHRPAYYSGPQSLSTRFWTLRGGPHLQKDLLGEPPPGPKAWALKCAPRCGSTRGPCGRHAGPRRSLSLSLLFCPPF